MIALTNCDIYSGAETLMAHAVLIEDGRVVDVPHLQDIPPSAEVIDLGGLNVAPGFIDLQVNGGDGLFFTDEPSTDALVRIVEAHARRGTAYVTPAVVTCPLSTLRAACEAVESYQRDGGRHILGLHIEGPLLNPAKGGAHDRSLITDQLTPELYEVYTDSSVALVTLAPEVVGDAAISRLTAAGARIAAGHTEATVAEIDAAVTGGLRLGTHVFNAMTMMTSRDAGTTGALLANDSCWCSFICDGFHVDFRVLKTAFRSKPQGRAFLVTDATSCVGTDLKSFQVFGVDVFVDESGRCTTSDGTLAGSTLDMATAVRNAVQQIGVPRDEALRMASLYPAQFLGVDDELGRIAAGYRASLVVFDNELYVQGLIFEGEVPSTLSALAEARTTARGS